VPHQGAKRARAFAKHGIRKGWLEHLLLAEIMVRSSHNTIRCAKSGKKSFLDFLDFDNGEICLHSKSFPSQLLDRNAARQF